MTKNNIYNTNQKIITNNTKSEKHKNNKANKVDKNKNNKTNKNNNDKKYKWQVARWLADNGLSVSKLRNSHTLALLIGPMVPNMAFDLAHGDWELWTFSMLNEPKQNQGFDVKLKDWALECNEAAELRCGALVVCMLGVLEDDSPLTAVEEPGMTNSAQRKILN